MSRFQHVYVLNVMSDDHPGIVAAVCDAIDSLSGNIDSCSQTVLGGFFTLITILSLLGIDRIGAPGSTAAVALLNDAVKKGGLFASSSVGGLSGAFIPVSEDAALAEAVGKGHLVLEKLEAMTAVCSVGLDMIAIPGDTPTETIAAIIADEMAIGVINNKTTATRLVPVPGAKAGEVIDFGGLFGTMPVMEVRNAGASQRFVHFGGRIPAPLQSLGN